jgi:uncharacterized protein (DUF1501 family)
MRCIECEEIELARVRDDRPVQTMEIPNAALEGFPEGRSPSALTRRRLLQFGVAGVASVYGARALGFEEMWESVAAAADAPTNKCLVLLYLAGGNDGLNVVLPNGVTNSRDYDAYKAARPNIHRGVGPSTTGTGARVGSFVLPGRAGEKLAFSNAVVSSTGAGDNNGDIRGLDTLFGDGSGGDGSKLAIMHAVDAVKYNLSHFDNSDIWFRASNDINTKTGWLGRWIDRNGSATNPLQAVSIDTALSKAIRTNVNPVCAIPSLPMTGFTHGTAGHVSPSGSPAGHDVNAQIQKLAGLPVSEQNAYLSRARATYGLAVDTYMDSKDSPFVATSGYPTLNATSTTPTLLSRRLQTAAHLIENLGTRVVTIHWGSFDTHTNQVTGHDNQLKELSRALAAFQADLESRLIDDRVATLVFSEFGRRVSENGVGAAAGTDHGAGGLMMAMGTNVKGGLASRWPGCTLTDLVPSNLGQGNLKVANDYRSVYQSVIAEWLGDADPAGLIGGGPIEALTRDDGLTGLFK